MGYIRSWKQMNIADVINLFFGWPNGGVWSNVVADILWSTPVVLGTGWALLRRMEKHHQEKLAQAQDHHNEVMRKLA